jgi:hypothetical protein
LCDHICNNSSGSGKGNHGHDGHGHDGHDSDGQGHGNDGHDRHGHGPGGSTRGSRCRLWLKIPEKEASLTAAAALITAATEKNPRDVGHGHGGYGHGGYGHGGLCHGGHDHVCYSHDGFGHGGLGHGGLGHGGHSHGGHSHDTNKKELKEAAHAHTTTAIHKHCTNVHKRDLCWALWSVSSSGDIMLTDWYPGHRLWGTCLYAR